MSTALEGTATASDRIQLPFHFDADKMLEEVRAMGLGNFIYYNVIMLRAPAHQIDPSLPVPPTPADFADGTWTEWLDAPQLASAPYLASVINTFRQHTQVNLVRLLRLEPGAVVKEHRDPTLALEEHKSVVRFTVPILNAEGVEFFLNDQVVDMQPGECWYLRLSDPHKVVNAGSTERINLTIDMIPNDWVRSLILNSES